MTLKRHFFEVENEGSEVPDRELKRRSFASTVREAMNKLSMHEFELMLVPFLQKVVREEVERALYSALRPTLNQAESPGARTWQLQFVNQFPSTLFTNSKIEFEDGQPCKVVLVDATFKNIISGPLSSVKIEIIALDGDVVADDQEDWDEKQFLAKIVRERDGKRPLLTGDLVVTLRDGVGYIRDITFTDNSSWIRSRRFRLGARIQNASHEVRIREAISEAFVVKDHRGESYRKHHPPRLNDEVWRLERIAKDGACYTRLNSQGISTVQDFLRLYFRDSSCLRNILGGGVSNRIWETIIEHAKTCIMDNKFYIYYMTAERTGLLLNSVYEVVGVTFDGENYLSPENVNAFDMCLVEDLKRHAYQNLNDLVPVDDPSLVGHHMLLSAAQPELLSSSCLGLQNVFNVQQDQLEMPMTIGLASSPQYSHEVEQSSHLELSGTHNTHGMQLLTPPPKNNLMIKDSYRPYGGENDCPPSNSLGPDAFSRLPFDDLFQVDASALRGNGLFMTQNNEALDVFSPDFNVHVSKKETPRGRWRKIQVAIKLLSIRRDVAIKKMNRRLFLNF